MKVRGFLCVDSQWAHMVFTMVNDELHLATPNIGYGSFKEKLPISATLTLVSLVVMGALIAPLIALWIYLLSIQLGILAAAQITMIFKAPAVFGLFALIATLAYLIFMNLPLPFTKNLMSLRWGFLVKNYPVGQHPRIPNWIRKKD